MDRRGHTTDPNANPGGPKAWWATLGPTQSPSPYATASWKYLQDFTSETVEVLADVTVVYDNGDIYSGYLQPVVFDGGLFNPPTPPTVVLDGGGYNSSGEIVNFETTTFATVYVYDSYASYPDVRGLNKVILDLGDLATDPQEDSLLITTEDGLLIEDEMPAQTVNDSPPGNLLGELSYTMTEKRVEVTSWSHYNWQDSSPVKQAFRAMIDQLPACTEGVYVQDDPQAFWQSLGFRFVNKGDRELKFFPVRYRGY